jgi:hypothetical protein
MLSIRGNFAGPHLQASARAAHNVHTIETTSDMTKLGPGFDDVMLLVPTSIVMAGAALEANANEFIQDILDGRSGLWPTDGCKALLTDIKAERSGSALDRYRKVALLFDKAPDAKAMPWVEAAHLVQFRNYFMHFKPVWQHPGDASEGNLVKALKAKLPAAGPYRSTQFLFPHALLTYACAKWAVSTVINFSAYFSSLMGVKDRFIPLHPNLTLP